MLSRRRAGDTGYTAAEVIAHGRCTFRAGKPQFAIVGAGLAGLSAALRLVTSPAERQADRLPSEPARRRGHVT